MSDYDRIGFASGIYFSKFHQTILKFASENLPENKKVFMICTYGGSAAYKSLEFILKEKKTYIIGKFGCKGYDTFGPFKLVGGIAKGHPDEKDLYFIGKTDEEISLVCETNDVPENTIEREDGWRGFRIQGILDFSLIGILSKLSGILADNKIGIFAVSTFNTDYILVKDADFEKSLAVLLNAGDTVI